MSQPPTREELLRRVIDKRADGEGLEWPDLSDVIQGLVFAARPIRAATHNVTEEYSLGPRGAWILSLIWGGIIYPADISVALKIGRSLVTAELNRLTDAGLITARAGKTDRRRSELALTELGEQASEQVRQEMARIVNRNLASYSAEEIGLFGRMLRDVRQDDAGDALDF